MGRQESDEQVQDVDAQSVCDYIESVDEVHAEGVDEEDDECAYPSASGVGSRLIQVVLRGGGGDWLLVTDGVLFVGYWTLYLSGHLLW